MADCYSIVSDNRCPLNAGASGHKVAQMAVSEISPGARGSSPLRQVLIGAPGHDHQDTNSNDGDIPDGPVAERHDMNRII